MSRRSPHFTGWSEYRYGQPKKVSLAPIFGKIERKRVLAGTIKILEDWRLSHFESEAAVRAGLRSSLCLKGYDWARADAEAAAIVAAGLKAIGAQRPSWAEGQWHYSVSLDYCSWCHSPIDEEGRTRAQRFCSAECARFALERRVYEAGRHHDRVGASAYRTVLRLESEPRPCKWCGTHFRSASPAAAYCSPACARRSKGDGLADRACLWCGTTFHPRSRSMVCCSQQCSGHHQVMVYRETAPERSCLLCNSVFRPSQPYEKYCSPRCVADVRNARFRCERADKRQVRIAEVRECEWCARAFSGRGPTVKCCSSNCAVYLSRARAGQFHKRLSGPALDFVLRRSGARITCEAA